MLPQKSKLSGPHGIELKKISEVIELIRTDENIVSNIWRIYKKTLLRNPDSQGLNYYKNEIKSGRLAIDELGKIFKQSAEYKELQKKYSIF